MTPTATTQRKLQTAEERREDVLAAARQEFARRGYYGTPTTDIAKAAGISQAYLFRLFPTKEELFVGCVERTYADVVGAFARAAAPHVGAPDEEIQRFFAKGMLLNTLAATGAHELDEPWARALMCNQDN